MEKTEELTARLRSLVAKMHAYAHAEGVLYYDAATIAPPGGAERVRAGRPPRRKLNFEPIT